MKRTGYFDDSNGIYLELNGSNIISFNIRNSAFGSITENRIAQSNWNVDRLDGTGASGYRLDMSKLNYSLQISNGWELDECGVDFL